MTIAVTGDPEVEHEMVQSLSLDDPRALIDRFSTLVRESGSRDEWTAARYIAGRLKAWGIPHTLHEPELFLSVPKSATLAVRAPAPRSLRAKTPAFSASTGRKSVRGRVAYVSTGYAADSESLFDSHVQAGRKEIEGKIVLTEGMPMPKKVADLAALGAKALVFINPGQAIHEGICTTIWGAPDLDSIGRKPAIPVVAINHPDGLALKAQVEAGPVEVAVKTKLDEGWKRCPVLVAEIPGTDDPERFVLVHGHIDSWHVGIGDNATGDAALMELARVFWKQRRHLRRSLRLAWWPGHSTGRYAGSTWYADTFAQELDERCVAQVDIDSPGCRWATEYTGISWMNEAAPLCRAAIRDTVGQAAEGERPHQAGDYSFNNIGITSFYMLLSTMPESLRKEKGYYAVGGCGANIQWHTEDDALDLLDTEILMKDLRVYVVSLLRTLNAPVHPFDFRLVAEEFGRTLEDYQRRAGGAFDLAPARTALGRLWGELDGFYRRTEELHHSPVRDERALRACAVIRRVARILIPLNFTRDGRFRHDPAVPIPPLPDLAPAGDLAQYAAGSHEARVIQTTLLRGMNRVVAALNAAGEEIAGSR
ncbi:MAG TPA: M28 family peptidase [bacterium]|nr:M28 family peptidase [bacterium]